jgi:uncharacterized membrane protein
VNEFVVAGIHWLHVFCGIFWFGTILFTRVMLFPALRAAGGTLEADVRATLVQGRTRTITVWLATGTVGLGILRGVVIGVHERLDTAYGLTYLAALVIGLAMLVWLLVPWLKQPIFGKLYVAGFPLMFSLMVAMRFGW